MDSPHAAAPSHLFHGLNPEQAQAVACITGPVCILAGAGSGKTTTITRRIAHQVASGRFPPAQILAVTFTEKAAREMGTRLASLGVTGVRVKTFHAEALAQHRAITGRELEILPSKTPILLPLVQRLPLPHKFVGVREVAAEIEWARNRRISAQDYPGALGDRVPPIPADLMAGVYGSYQRRKAERGLLDFEDLLEATLALLEEGGPTARVVQEHYLAFSVDEYQDVNLLQQSLLEAWVGERRDLCVVGDDYQSIFGFTGATPRYLVEFPLRYPDCHVVQLDRNYRSTPEVLSVANRLVAQFGPAPRHLRAPEGPPGDGGERPAPALRTFGTGADEVAWIVSEAQRLQGCGVAWEEMAVLYRINGRSEPLEQALAAARIPYQVAGAAFLRRPAARAVLAALRRAPVGPAGVAAAVEQVVGQMGYRPEADPAGAASGEEATRQADLGRLLALGREYPGDGGMAGFLADLQRRFAPDVDGRGMQILTYHRAKGKEFDAVFLPRLEDKELPFALAKSPEERDEERRLLYVGITRARRHLNLTWAASRTDGPQRRLQPSPFLEEIRPRSAAPIAAPPPGPRGPDSPLLAALKDWRREEAKQRSLPAYVIFHDRTLAEIASAQPADASELLAFSGVGPAKVANYGDAVLALVQAHAPA